MATGSSGGDDSSATESEWYESDAPPSDAALSPVKTEPEAPVETPSEQSFNPSSDATNLAAMKCAKCQKATLSEVATLTPQLADAQALRCHCCGLCLPEFCFTKPQREAQTPGCRGCRGVPTIVGKLTARAQKLLLEQQHSQEVSVNAPVDGTATSATSATPASSTTAGQHEECTQCHLPLGKLSATDLRAKKTFKCSCCERECPGRCFSMPQLQKGGTRRCKGCLGHIGSPSKDQVKAGMKAWQQNNPTTQKRMAKKRLVKLTRQLDLAKRTEGKFTAKEIKQMEKRLAKFVSRMKSRQLLTDDVIEDIAERVEYEGDDEDDGDEEEHASTKAFRKRVAKYKFAVLALARKHEANDLMGSTRIEYMKQLAKEEAVLKKRETALKRKNSKLFDEVMGLEVKPPRGSSEEKKKKKRGRSEGSDSDQSRAGGDVEVDDAGAARSQEDPVPKKAKQVTVQ
jgi:hypothetical protein